LFFRYSPLFIESIDIDSETNGDLLRCHFLQLQSRLTKNSKKKAPT